MEDKAITRDYYHLDKRVLPYSKTVEDLSKVNLCSDSLKKPEEKPRSTLKRSQSLRIPRRTKLWDYVSKPKEHAICEEETSRLYKDETEEQLDFVDLRRIPKDDTFKITTKLQTHSDLEDESELRKIQSFDHMNRKLERYTAPDSHINVSKVNESEDMQKLIYDEVKNVEDDRLITRRIRHVNPDYQFEKIQISRKDQVSNWRVTTDTSCRKEDKSSVSRAKISRTQSLRAPQRPSLQVGGKTLGKHDKTVEEVIRKKSGIRDGIVSIPEYKTKDILCRDDNIAETIVTERANNLPSKEFKKYGNSNSASSFKEKTKSEKDIFMKKSPKECILKHSLDKHLSYDAYVEENDNAFEKKSFREQVKSCSPRSEILHRAPQRQMLEADNTKYLHSKKAHEVIRKRPDLKQKYIPLQKHRSNDVEMEEPFFVQRDTTSPSRDLDIGHKTDSLRFQIKSFPDEEIPMWGSPKKNVRNVSPDSSLSYTLCEDVKEPRTDGYYGKKSHRAVKSKAFNGSSNKKPSSPRYTSISITEEPVSAWCSPHKRVGRYCTDQPQPIYSSDVDLIHIWRFGETQELMTFPKDGNINKAIVLIANILGLDSQALDLLSQNKIMQKFGTFSDHVTGNPKILYIIQKEMERQVPLGRETLAPDMIDPWEDDVPRVLMSCGHGITCDNLFTYCLNQLQNGFVEFVCPAVPDQERPTEQCAMSWDFEEVRERACLSNDECNLFEIMLSHNRIRRLKNTNVCPLCSKFIESDCSNFTVCKNCMSHGGDDYKFCKFCLQKWSNVDQYICKNRECQTSKQKLRNILKSCPTKDIVDIPGCPVVRACPECDVLVEHEGDNCKHMDCPNQHCRTKFCFVCLQVKTDKYYWPESCGGAFIRCEVAPRQSI